MLAGTLTITAAGAISARDGDCTGSTVATDNSAAKVAAEVGRYRIQVDRKYRRIVPCQPTLEGPADAAMGNVDANAACVRNVSTNLFDVQLFLASSGADTETTSGNKIHWSCWAQEI